MRIGILTHNYPRTANERKDAGIFIYDFSHKLVKKADVFIFCPNSFGKKEKDKKVSVTWFNWPGGKEKFGDWNAFNPLSLWKFFYLLRTGKKEILKFIKQNKIDFCLACWVLPSGIFAQEAKRKIGTPYAVWGLGSDINKYVRYPFLRQITADVLREADLRFANSYLLREKIKQLTRKDCRFLPAITNFDIKNIKPKKLTKDRFNFLFVGRLEKVKGPDILLEACYLLSKKFANFTLSFLGDGKLAGSLKNKTLRWNLKKHVNFSGNVSGSEVAAYMLGSDALVIPSRSESLPLVLIEAARVNLPLIATKVGDCGRLIKKYKIGELVEKEDAEKLAKIMLKFIRQKNSLKKRYRVGFKKLLNEFNQKEAVDVFLEKIKNFL